MEAAVAKVLLEAAEEIGLEVKHDKRYSGRGMMGRETESLTVENNTDLLRMVAVAAARISESANGLDETEINLDEFTESLDFSRDSMGRSIVIY